MQERLQELLRNRAVVVGISSAASAGIAAYISHVITKKHVEKKFNLLMEKEIEEAKVFYQKRSKTGEFSSPDVLAAAYSDEEVGESMEEAEQRFMAEAAQKVEELMYKSGEDLRDIPEEGGAQTIEVQESIKKNVFENHDPVADEDDDFDVEYEKEHNRNSNSPYIISHDEFFDGDLDYSQNTVTYFEGDDVLVDDADRPIREIGKTVGEDNLIFGKGSKDKNIVYIRNDWLSIDFEVIRSYGKYTEEVLGFLEHSDKSRPRKFRDRD